MLLRPKIRNFNLAPYTSKSVYGLKYMVQLYGYEFMKLMKIFIKMNMSKSLNI